MTYTINGGTVLTQRVKLTTTAVTDVLTAKGKTMVVRVYAAEIAGGTAALDVEVFDGVTSYYLLKGKAMVANTPYEIDCLENLKTGDVLRVKASAANAIDVSVSYLPGDKLAMGAPV